MRTHGACDLLCRWERWGLIPSERLRLLRLIRSTNAKGVVLLSGDRHTGGLYKVCVARQGLRGPQLQFQGRANYSPLTSNIQQISNDVVYVDAVLFSRTSCCAMARC